MMVLTSNRLTVPSFTIFEKNLRAFGGVVEALKFHRSGAMPLTESAPTLSCPANELSNAFLISSPTSSPLPFEVTFFRASISSTMVYI